MPKHSKQAILNDQKVVANSLANKKKNVSLSNDFSFSGDPFQNSETKIDESNKKMKKDDVIIMNMCGRGDKDLSAVLPKLKAMGKI